MKAVASLEERFTSVVSHMSHVGIPVELERWDEVIEEARQNKEKLISILDGYLGDVELPEKFKEANKTVEGCQERVNWHSHPQKLWAIEEALGLELPTKWDPKTKEQKPTLDKNHIHLLEHPIGATLRQYHEIMNFPSTFANAIVARGSDNLSRYYEGGFIYPDGSQLEARTGRMSCSNPPMHGMPRKTKLREAIVAPDGYRLVALDFSQIEPRILAALSRDKGLLKIYRSGDDFYRVGAARVIGIDKREVTPDQRSIFKAILLGLIYGMTKYGLTARIHRDIDPNMSVEKVVAYRDGIFSTFPGAAKWRSEKEREFESGSRETRTELGRRRLNVENKRQRWNAPIQGAAADAFKAAATALYERMDEVGGVKIVALIHDEVVLMVPEENVDTVEEWAKSVMSEAAASIINTKLPEKLHVPVIVDGGHGKTLQEAKGA
jgi:DNA polymerase-1